VDKFVCKKCTRYLSTWYRPGTKRNGKVEFMDRRGNTECVHENTITSKGSPSEIEGGGREKGGLSNQQLSVSRRKVKGEGGYPPSPRNSPVQSSLPCLVRCQKKVWTASALKHMLQYVCRDRFVGYSANIFRMGNDEKIQQAQRDPSALMGR
jgi:hypothetical protein